MIPIVVLAIWGAPASTITLKALAKIQGIKMYPVFERNEKVAKDIARIYRERYGDHAPVFENPETFLPGTPILCIESSSSPHAVEQIKKIQPEYIVLAGSGIVKETLLKIPRRGTLNAHPGLLPRYRGCTCVEWAIFEDQPVGSTCHFVSTEIDAGDIVQKKVFPVYRGESYLDMRLRMLTFTAELLADSLQKLIHDETSSFNKIEKFDWESAQYYKPIPEDRLAIVKEKLDKGTYLYAQNR